ncbi:hypothetical protein DRJ25_01665 [Candidatus Woesearchaeota archaeon]|nr:MAG: hypothetical protein DRJ25_01665 [Candidatus Woesearchaeota archaeon]
MRKTKILLIIILLALFLSITACSIKEIQKNAVDKQQTNNPTKETETNCKDLCGDGVCQEFVCMSLGCPCAETAETCPQDCKEK